MLGILHIARFLTSEPAGYLQINQGGTIIKREEKQKDLEDKLLKVSLERAQFLENAKKAEARATQLESTLEVYRTQVEQISKQLSTFGDLNSQQELQKELEQKTQELQQAKNDLETAKHLLAETLSRLETLQREYEYLKNNPEVRIVEKIVEVPSTTSGQTTQTTEGQTTTTSQPTNEEAAPPPSLPPPPPPPGPPPPPPPKPPGPPPPPGGLTPIKKRGPSGPGPTSPALPVKVGGPVPKVKMVQFNWKKLTDSATPDSFWANASDCVDELKTEFGNLEELFGAKKSAATLKTESSSSNLSISAVADDKSTSKAQAVTLLDFKRAQALSILLSRLRKSNEEIRAAILSFDVNKISPEDLKTLHKNAPTAEEIEMLKSYPDDPATLGKPEQFYLAIIDIPRLTSKLEAFLFTQKFASQVEELRPDIEAVSEASTQLKESKKFARVLELVLALGNFVNGGTFRGGFYGFKLDSLLALNDVRSPSDPKLSLLHYFGRFLREKYPDLLNFSDELSALESAKRISLQTIASEVATLRKELRAATREAEESINDSPSVHVTLTASLGHITPQFEALDTAFRASQKSFHEVVAYFGDSVKSATPEEFFSIVAKFSAQLDQVHKDAAYKKERAEKEAKRAAQAAQRKSAGYTSSPLRTPHSNVNSSFTSSPFSPQVDSSNNNYNFNTPTTPSILDHFNQ